MNNIYCNYKLTLGIFDSTFLISLFVTTAIKKFDIGPLFFSFIFSLIYSFKRNKCSNVLFFLHCLMFWCHNRLLLPILIFITITYGAYLIDIETPITLWTMLLISFCIQASNLLVRTDF